jgi:ubiquinone/menaquinone biosynthesis C-methylase UbiE
MMTEQEWSEETSRVYAQYMETNVPHDHRPHARRITADWPELPAGAVALDVAGGPAFLLLEIAPLLREPRLILADSSPIMLKIARGRAIETILSPAEKIALPDASVDLVLCKHFLRLAPDLDAALREMARVLKPAGRAYLIDFNAEGPWLGTNLLKLWILLTAPRFLSGVFGQTLRASLPASSLPARCLAAGFASAEVLTSGVSYLARASKEGVRGEA